MNPWGASNMGSGNDWEQQINAYISNLMRPRNQVAEYQAGLANTSQNPGAYYQQLQIPAQQAAEQERLTRLGLLAAQVDQAREQAKLTGAQAATEGIRNSEEWTGGTSLLSPGRMSHPFMAMGGGGGGGGGGMGGLVPNESMGEEEARKKKGWAEAAMYDSMVSGDTYVGPGAGWGAAPGGASYDPSTSSYGSASGGGW
jgi:hypothetical protein